MNIFFIGMGNMGKKHLLAINALKNKFNLKINGYYDPGVKKIKINNSSLEGLDKINKKYLMQNEIDFCIISTPHYLTKKYVDLIYSTRKKIDIFVEKPLGLNFREANQICKNKIKGQKLYVGLNYRFFNGIKKLIIDLKKKKFGNISSLELFMGHGQNPQIQKSWKLDKVKSGGGAIIDPGIHLINLIQQIVNSKIKVTHTSVLKNFFWKTGIEEKTLILLSTKKIPLILLNISIVNWRGEFSIKVNGNKGYGYISGRGSHYGNQIYKTGLRWGWLNSKTKNQEGTEIIQSNSSEKNVFLLQMKAVIFDIKKKKQKIKPSDHNDALKSMKLINEIYKCQKRKF